MHWTYAKMKQNFDTVHYCRITPPWMTDIFWTIPHCCSILVSATPPKVFDAGTWNLKHSSGMQFCFRSLLQNYIPLNDIHFLDHITLYCSCLCISSFSIWCRDLKLAAQFRHALNICTREKKEKKKHPGQYCRIMSPEWDTFFDNVTLWYSSCHPNSSYSIWCRDFKIDTQVRHAFGICIKETEVWSRSYLQNLVPLKRYTCSPFVMALAISFINWL